jgi:DMSO/TMAO reductase YedYZ molybdopterin-dependent catalytic subunit
VAGKDAREKGADGGPTVARGLRWRLTVAGLAATCAITLVTAVLHVLVFSLAYPPEAIAQNAVGLTSGGIDSFFIERLGHWAQYLTVIGLSIGFALSGAALVHLVPRTWRRRTWWWPVLPLPLWAVTVAVYSAPPPFLSRWAFAAASLPIFLAGGLVGAWVLSRTEVAARPSRGSVNRHESPLDPHVTRRAMLAALGAGTVGVAVGSSALATVLSGGSDTGAKRLRVSRVTSASPPPAAPGDAAFAHIPGLVPEVTPTEQFYVVDKDVLNPVLDPSTWRLTVHGLVERPMTLSYSDLRSMDSVERYQTLECISNQVGGHLMSTALWTGIPLGDILRRAGVRSSARTVVLRAAGGYSESHSLDKAMDPTTLIAIGMNRHQLPRQHGYPARLLTVGTYGMKNPKWLTDLELIEGNYRGYWEQRGWAPDVDPKITTRIDVPSSGAPVGSKAVIAGVAFAGDRGISRVEVSTDGGRSWQDAALKTALSPYTWRLWMFEWKPPRPGEFLIMARAFDGTGRMQTETPAQPFPSGAAGLDGVTVRAS